MAVRVCVCLVRVGGWVCVCVRACVRMCVQRTSSAQRKRQPSHNGMCVWCRSCGVSLRYSFTKSAVAAIEAHDATKPLFLFVAFQNLHPPLQVPHEFVQKYPTELQTTINGMTTFLDESVGNVTRALKSTGLWDNTLVVCT